MPALFALIATLLTSFLPITNKVLLRDARPALVAWAVNAASLTILAASTLLLTQCSVASGRGVSCAASALHVDLLFFLALLAAAALNWGATLFSIRALAAADASLVTPLLTFNPAFTLLVAWLPLGETPGLRQGLGVGVILFGSYLLGVEEAQAGFLAPLVALIHRPGSLLAIIASALWGITTVLEKLAIQHVTPPSGPLVALAGTILTVALLTPGAFIRRHRAKAAPTDAPGRGLGAHLRAFLAAVLIAGIAPLFGFTAIATGLVGYVTSLFKLSAVFTIFWARLFLREGSTRQRLLGSVVMIVGGVLVAI